MSISKKKNLMVSPLYPHPPLPCHSLTFKNFVIFGRNFLGFLSIILLCFSFLPCNPPPLSPSKTLVCVHLHQGSFTRSIFELNSLWKSQILKKIMSKLKEAFMKKSVLLLRGVLSNRRLSNKHFIKRAFFQMVNYCKMEITIVDLKMYCQVHFLLSSITITSLTGITSIEIQAELR